jgi:hypothetical protein
MMDTLDLLVQLEHTDTPDLREKSGLKELLAQRDMTVLLEKQEPLESLDKLERPVRRAILDISEPHPRWERRV